MKRVCAIVEGFGDVDAMPSLVARTAAQDGKVVICPNPIRGGEWPKIKRAGELERLLELAASRNVDHILIAVDLDDDCPVTEANAAHTRIDRWKNGREIKVSIVFFVREYEALFLHQPEVLGDIDANRIPKNPENLRGAKEALKPLIGRRYKETSDQKAFSEKLDTVKLRDDCRCFRKFAKEVCE